MQLSQDSHVQSQEAFLKREASWLLLAYKVIQQSIINSDKTDSRRLAA